MGSVQPWKSKTRGLLPGALLGHGLEDKHELISPSAHETS